MLIEQLKTERIEAMKAKDTIKKDLLGTLIAEASKEDKVPSDEKVIATIKKFIKNTTELMVSCKGYQDKFDSMMKANDELKILESYLPAQLDEDTIRKIFSLNTFANVGKAMGYFKANYSGQYDGALVSKIAKELIN